MTVWNRLFFTDILWILKYRLQSLIIIISQQCSIISHVSDVYNYLNYLNNNYYFGYYLPRNLIKSYDYVMH